MTFLGKLFLFLNLALSLALATFAFGVYSSGIDWSDNPAKGAQQPGKLVARKNEVNELSKNQLPLANQSWKAARTELWTREDQRRVERAWYATELSKLYPNKEGVVVQQVVQEKAGGDGGGRPKLEPAAEAEGVPLRTLGYYLARQQEHREENARIRMELEAKVKEDVELTNQLTGDPERKTRGLRQLLNDERAKRLGIIDEVGITEGIRVNTTVGSELVLRRLESINQRIRELEAYLKKVHGVDAVAKRR